MAHGGAGRVYCFEGGPPSKRARPPDRPATLRARPDRRRAGGRAIPTLLWLSAIGGLVACGDGEGGSSAPAEPPAAPPPRYAFVVNNPSTFWKIAEVGVRRAAEEINVQADFRTPQTGSVDEQQRILEELLARNVDGIAISPIDPANMTRILNEAAARTILITHDSDAPESDRRAYIGTNNYAAGRIAGEEIKKALPEGGRIVIFVGRLDAQNARERRQGILDVLEGTLIEVLDTRLDYGDQAKARENVEAMLVAHPDLDGMAGLWAYNGPAIVSAVREAGRIGRIKIVCFDEEEATLQAIRDGEIEATIVQKPFEFGYQSIRLLHALRGGDASGVPPDRLIDTGVTVVTRDNVEAFWAELRERLQ